MKANVRSDTIYGWVVLNFGTLGHLAMMIVLRLGPLYSFPFCQLTFLYSAVALALFYFGICFYGANLEKIWNLSKWTHIAGITSVMQYYFFFSALTKIGFGDSIAVYVTGGK